MRGGHDGERAVPGIVLPRRLQKLLPEEEGACAPARHGYEGLRCVRGAPVKTVHFFIDRPIITVQDGEDETCTDTRIAPDAYGAFWCR